MSDFIVALGLVLVIEGVLYAAAPAFARRMAETAAATPDTMLRMGGLIAATIGLGIVWLIRSG